MIRAVFDASTVISGGVGCRILSLISCALAVPAEFIVSRDRDLLDLGKPFGVEIVTPRAFLNRVHARL